MYQWMSGSAEKSRLAVLIGEEEIISDLGEGVGFSIEEARKRAYKFRREIEELRKHAARLEENEAALSSLLAEWDDLEKSSFVSSVSPEDERDALLDAFDAHGYTGGVPFYHSKRKPNVEEAVSKIFGYYGLGAVEFKLSGSGTSGNGRYFVLTVPKRNLKIAVMQFSWPASEWRNGELISLPNEHALYFEEIERIRLKNIRITPPIESFM